MTELVSLIKRLLHDIILFAQHGSGLTLRRYQEQVALAVADSVIHGRGLSFVVMFPRQSGKNELQAQIEVYLLTLFSQLNAEIVKVSPTFKPQTVNAMRRLERVLSRNLITRDRWQKEAGYIYRVGSARIFFLSGSPTANVVGATASTLLECDEAQDVLPSKWDKDFSPMAASTNATRVFWGTAWTSRTLLARELRAAREAQQLDGIRRVFVLTAEDVGQEVPAYAAFVREQVAKLGRNHPMVRTQFFSEEIDAEGGMFPPARQAIMHGSHPAQAGPTPGSRYALLIDVAGEDEGRSDEAGLDNPMRDSTAVTVVEVDLATLADDLIQAPSYRVVHRRLWTGAKHTQLYGELRGLADLWSVDYLVIDSTGVGAGLASFLDKAFPGKVIPFIFSAKSKSDLGWGFLAAIETGRFKDHAAGEYDQVPGAGPAAGPAGLAAGSAAGRSSAAAAEATQLQQLFWEQVDYCQAAILDGPARLMRWSVPNGTRSTETGEVVHDDLLLSAALVAQLDQQSWFVSAQPLVIPGQDPLSEMDHGDW